MGIQPRTKTSHRVSHRPNREMTDSEPEHKKGTSGEHLTNKLLIRDKL